MDAARPARSLTRRYAALIGALTLLAHAGVNAIHDRQMRTEVRDSVRGFASPELAKFAVQFERMKAGQERDFVRKTDLAPLTHEIHGVHQEVGEQGQRLARMEGYLKAQLDLQRKDHRRRAGLPGSRLQANADWELEKPYQHF